MKKIITIIILLAVIAAAIVWSVRTSINNKNTAQALLWGQEYGTIPENDLLPSPTWKEEDTYPGDEQIPYQTNVGCLQPTACDYVNKDGNLTAAQLAEYTQGPSCLWAWYQSKSGANFTPAFEAAQTDTIKIPPIKKSQVCSVRGGCTTGLFVKGRIVYYDGRTPAVLETDPSLHAYVTDADAKKYAGTSACDAWSQLSGDIVDSFHPITTPPRSQTNPKTTPPKQINQLR